MERNGASSEVNNNNNNNNDGNSNHNNRTASSSMAADDDRSSDHSSLSVVSPGDYAPSPGTSSHALGRANQLRVQALLRQLLMVGTGATNNRPAQSGNPQKAQRDCDSAEADCRRIDILRVLRKCLRELDFQLSWLTQVDLLETIERILRDDCQMIHRTTIDWRLIHDCTQLLIEAWPRLLHEIDSQMIEQIVPSVVQNLGHERSEVRRASLLLLNVLINNQSSGGSGSFNQILKLFIDYGLANCRNEQAQRGAILSLPLLMNEQTIEGQDLLPLIRCLSQLLVDSREHLFYSLYLALQRMHLMLGDQRFKHYLSQCEPEASLLYHQAASRNNSVSTTGQQQQQTSAKRRQSKVGSTSSEQQLKRNSSSGGGDSSEQQKQVTFEMNGQQPPRQQQQPPQQPTRRQSEQASSKETVMMDEQRRQSTSKQRQQPREEPGAAEPKPARESSTSGPSTSNNMNRDEQQVIDYFPPNYFAQDDDDDATENQFVDDQLSSDVFNDDQDELGPVYMEQQNSLPEYDDNNNIDDEDADSMTTTSINQSLRIKNIAAQQQQQQLSSVSSTCSSDAHLVNPAHYMTEAAMHGKPLANYERIHHVDHSNVASLAINDMGPVCNTPTMEFVGGAGASGYGLGGGLSGGGGAGGSQFASGGGELKFGIFPKHLVLAALNARYPNRLEAMQELMCIIRESPINHLAILMTYFDSFLEQFLARIMQQGADYKLELIAIDMIETIIVKTKVSAMRYIRPTVGLLVRTLADTRSIFRENTIRVLHKMMAILPPQHVIDAIFEHKHNKSALVREESINRVTAAVLEYSRSEFNLTKLCYHVLPMLADHSSTVRLASLECIATLAHSLGPERIGSLLTAAEAVQTGCDYDGLLDAINARLMRHTLPRCNSDGSIRYVLKPFLGPQGAKQHQEQQAADVRWVLEAPSSHQHHPELGPYYHPHQRHLHKQQHQQQSDREPQHAHHRLGVYSPPDWSQRRRRSSLGLTQLVIGGGGGHHHHQSDQEDGDEQHHHHHHHHHHRPHHHHDQSEAEKSDGGGGDGRQQQQQTAKRRSGGGDTATAGAAGTVSPPPPAQSPAVAAKTSVPNAKLVSHHHRKSDAKAVVADVNSSPFGGATVSENNQQQGEDVVPVQQQKQLQKSRGKQQQKLPASSLKDRRSNSQDSLSSTDTNKILFQYYLGKFKQSLVDSNAEQAVLPSDSIIYTDINQAYALSRHQSRQQQTSFDYEGDTVGRIPIASTSSASVGPAATPTTDTKRQLRRQSKSLVGGRQSPLSAGSESGSAGSPETVMEAPNNVAPARRHDSGGGGGDRSDRAAQARHRKSLSHHSSQTDEEQQQQQREQQHQRQTMRKKSASSSAAQDAPQRTMSTSENDFNHHHHQTQPEQTDAEQQQQQPRRKSVSSTQHKQLEEQQQQAAADARKRSLIRQSASETSQQHEPEQQQPSRKSSIASGGGILAKSSPSSSFAATSAEADLLAGRRQDSGDQASSTSSLQQPTPVKSSSVSSIRASETEADQQQRDARHRSRRRQSSHVQQQQEDDRDYHHEQQQHVDDDDEEIERRAATRKRASRSQPPVTRRTNQLQQQQHRASPPQQDQVLDQTAPFIQSAKQQATTSAQDIRRAISVSPSLANQQQNNVNIRHILENVAHLEGPFVDAPLALKVALDALESPCWSTKVEGLLALIRLVSHHHEPLVLNHLHEIVCRTADETRNLRSTVARSAIFALGDYCAKLKRHIEPEMDGIVRALLMKSNENTAFIRDDIRKALTQMADNLTHWRLAHSLIQHGSQHKSAQVRRMSAQFVALLVERMGAAKCLVGARDISAQVIPAAAKFAQDSSPHTRYFGRLILSRLMQHGAFERLLRRNLAPNLYRSSVGIVESVRRRGPGEPPAEN